MLKRLILLASVLIPGITPVSAQTQLGPFTTTATATASALMGALPANSSRRGFTICNGSATLVVTFTTGTVTPVSLTTGQVLPTGNVVASCFTTPGGITTGVGAQVNIISTGSAPVTFFEY
jgi:hypothetical protein